MKKVFLSIIFALTFIYLGMAFYHAEKTVFSCYEVNSIKKKLEKTEWKNYCHLEGIEKGEKTSYEYNCEGKLDRGKEELQESVENFTATTPGLIVWKVEVRLSNRSWNDPMLEPIKIYGLDFYWLFQ